MKRMFWSLRKEPDQSNGRHVKEAKPATTEAFPMSRFVSLNLLTVTVIECIRQPELEGPQQTILMKDSKKKLNVNQSCT